MKLQTVLDDDWGEDDVRRWEHDLQELRAIAENVFLLLLCFEEEEHHPRARVMLNYVRSEIAQHLLKDHLGGILTALDLVDLDIEDDADMDEAFFDTEALGAEVRELVAQKAKAMGIT